MLRIFRTRAYLKHKFLAYIDSQEEAQRLGTTVLQVVNIADIILNTSAQNAQEIYDELYITKLIEIGQEVDGPIILRLTPEGYLRLQHSHFLKEHYRILESKLKEYGVILTTLVLAVVSLIQANRDKSTENLEQLKNIRHSLSSIDTTLQRTGFSVVRDTVYLKDTAR